jgi:hypothetical protein
VYYCKKKGGKVMSFDRSGYGDYDKRKDPKRKQEIKMENHELKLVEDRLPTEDNQRLDIFGQTRGYSYEPSTKVIYMVRNTETGKGYIGQTENVDTRKTKHGSDLNQTCHDNSDMQLEYILYGCNSFVFEIVEFLNYEGNLLEREKFWIKYFNTEWPNGYNCPYEYNPEYSKRLSKEIVEEFAKLKKENVANLGKTKNYKKFIDDINRYKRTHWDVIKTPQWKTR